MDNTLPRRDFLTRSLAGWVAGQVFPSVLIAEEKDRPNIVLIMADDLGFSDIGCYGGEIKTPNLDDLAGRGLRLTQFYNNAMCAPTRASLLTGLYPQQMGIYNTSPGTYKNSVTLAELLKSAGYRTLMTGKWHADETPYKRGFDRHFGLCDGATNYFNPGLKREGEPEPGRKNSGEKSNRWAIDNLEYRPYTPEDKNFYTTDRFTDYAIDYLEKYGSEEKPFFLYVAYNAPHFPLHAWPEDIAKYRGKYRIGWDQLRRQRFERIKKLGIYPEGLALSPRNEECPAWDTVEDKDAWDLKMAVYAAMIDRMDQNIGRIIRKVRELGQEENTLFIFLSDNGGCSAVEHPTPDIPPGPVDSYWTYDKPWANASNTPFRKYKGSNFEAGFCTPFIVCWPKVIKKGGGFSNYIGHVIDIMPTFAEISGARYPAYYNGQRVLPMEGCSLLSAWKGNPDRHERSLCWRVIRNGHRAVRKGKWKMVTNKDNPWELYDLSKDQVEIHDLAKKHPDKVSELNQIYENWKKHVGLAKDDY